MKIPCDQHIACPGDDLALTNFSSEDPDRLVHLSRAYGRKYVPPIGDPNIPVDNCATFTSSPVSQLDADLCAERHQTECEFQFPLPDPCQVCRPASGNANQEPSFGFIGLASLSSSAVSAAPCCNPSDPAGCCCDPRNSDPDPGPSGPPSGPSTPDNPTPPGPKLYGNDVQTCTVKCPNGVSFSATIDAGAVVAPSKAQANAMAFSAACRKAEFFRICPDDSQGGGNPCRVFCVDEEASYQLNATSRQDNPLTWSIKDGSLPDGMTMDDSGMISGTPDSAGQSSFVTVQICDDLGNCTSRDYCFSVMGINEKILPDGAVDSAYAAQLHGTGGNPPYTWSVINGSTPDGVNMDVHGTFSGTPTKVGDFLFAVRITDHLGNLCEKGMKIHINGVTNTPQTVNVPCKSNPALGVSVTVPAGTVNHAPGYDQFTADAEARTIAFNQASAQLQANGCACFVKQLDISGSNHAGVVKSSGAPACSIDLRGVTTSLTPYAFPFTVISITPVGDIFSAPNTVNLDAYWDNLVGLPAVTFTVGFVPDGLPFTASNVLFWWTHNGH